MVNEIKSIFKKTILLSGCISTGRDIASALQMGADLAYMGTRFINVKESMADPEYQKMIINSKAEDIVYTAAVSGVNANFLRPSLEAMGITEELWNQIGNSKSIVDEKYPEFQERYLVESEKVYPVSFNGKLRFKINLETTLNLEQIKKIVLSNEKTFKYLEGKDIKKVIIVPSKIINIVC